jgi:hypothetical protein
VHVEVTSNIYCKLKYCAFTVTSISAPLLLPTANDYSAHIATGTLDLLHYGLRQCRCCYLFYKCITVSIVVIRKQSTLQEAEEPNPEPKESPMPVLRLTEGLERTQTGIKLSEDTNSKERRRGKMKHWITRVLACFEGITEGEQFFD